MASVFQLPPRILMGPGPSQVPSEVLAALSQPTIGHLDPAFLALLDEIREQLRCVFGTSNACTLPMSGTGSAGMETCLVNLLEPGDRVLLGLNGVFGTRMAEVARRAGAEVTAVESEWGRAVDADTLRAAAQGRSYKLLCAVHAETSTGVLQPLAPLKELASELGALLLADTVTSLGGVAVELDAQAVDVSYSGTQKCLSCPPGLSPVSLSARAMEAVQARKAPVQSWYLDLTLVGQYFGQERVYHHTAPINMLYALHTALAAVLDEGLPTRYQRHRQASGALQAGLLALGFSLPVPAEQRLPPLTLVQPPAKVSEKALRQHLLSQFGLELGGGLGKFAGQALRIGLMGASCTRRNVNLCLAALADALSAQGHACSASEALQASAAHFENG